MIPYRPDVDGLRAVAIVTVVASHAGPSRCALAREAFEEQREALAGALAAAMRNRPNVTLVDPALFLCNVRECPATVDGQVLYRDTAHLTGRASASFSERVRSWLDWLE